MTVVASVLVFAALLTIIAAVLFVIREAFRKATTPRPSARATTTSRTDDEPRPFGSLPTLSDPVGPLGNPAPDADLSSSADSARDIHGK